MIKRFLLPKHMKDTGKFVLKHKILRNRKRILYGGFVQKSGAVI